MNNIMKNNNKFLLILLGTIILISCIGIYSIKTANANTIEECETMIKQNMAKAEQVQQIKEQLHITAQLLREEGHINNGFADTLSVKWFEYDEYQKGLEGQNIELAEKIEEINNKRVFLGYFKITHYCPCSKCNGGYTGTAIGTKVTAGRTIAVDPKVIPLRSTVEIQGRTYTAEDTGSAIKGNRIDVAVSSHSEAYAKGVLNNVPVYIIKK